jgi:hypothetical protein
MALTKQNALIVCLAVLAVMAATLLPLATAGGYNIYFCLVHNACIGTKCSLDLCT